MRATREENMPKFQEIQPACFFCKAKHGGEGYDDLRVQDVVDGIEPRDFAYICPTCKPRRPEFDRIMQARTRRFCHFDSLRERGLFDFNEKYRLSEVDPAIRQRNIPAFEVMDKYPLESNVWVHGECGIGKSHTLRALTNRYAHALKTVACVNGADYSENCDELRSQRAAIFEPFKTADLVFLDDIDKGLKWTKSGLQILWGILDARERQGLRTIISSQKTPDAFFKTLDEVAGDGNSFSLSLLDRLKPLSVFEFKGRPRRGVQ